MEVRTIDDELCATDAQTVIDAAALSLVTTHGVEPVDTKRENPHQIRHTIRGRVTAECYA